MSKRINYRKIYSQHYGDIPLDEKGRMFQIHHIDGNRNNNNPTNLIALSIVDHFWEHWINGDYGACLLIASDIDMTFEERSRISKLVAKKRIENGTHNFLDKEWRSKDIQKRVKAGTHNFQNKQWASERSKRVSKKRLEEGTHNFQKLYPCDCGCNKSYNLGNLSLHRNGKKKAKVNI